MNQYFESIKIAYYWQIFLFFNHQHRKIKINFYFVQLLLSFQDCSFVNSTFCKKSCLTTIILWDYSHGVITGQNQRREIHDEFTIYCKSDIHLKKKDT